jgi:hypothetical protein
MRVFSLILIAILFSTSSVGLAKVKRADVTERAVMRDYSACVVKQKRDLAAAALLDSATNEQILKNYKGLIIGDCLKQATIYGGTMRFGGDLYRYALAEALVNEELRDITFMSFDDRATLAHHELPTKEAFEQALAAAKSKRKKEQVEKSFEDAVSNSWLSRFGECVVRSDPTRSKAWLLAKPSTPAEDAQVSALKPVFNSCLTGNGSMKFNRITMRGLVALNYFRLARAPVVQPAGAQN